MALRAIKQADHSASKSVAKRIRGVPMSDFFGPKRIGIFRRAVLIRPLRPIDRRMAHPRRHVANVLTVDPAD